MRDRVLVLFCLWVSGGLMGVGLSYGFGWLVLLSVVLGVVLIVSETGAPHE